MQRYIAPILFIVFGWGLACSLMGTLAPVPPNWLMIVTAGVLYGAALLQCLFTFKAPRPVILFLAIMPFMTFLYGAFDLLGWKPESAALVVSLSGMAVAYGLRDGIQQRLTGLMYLIFGFMQSWALYDLLEDTAFDVLIIGYGALMMYVSVLLSSRALLVVSTLSILGYLAHFTEKYFAHAVGWPLALIVMGVILVLISLYAVKLGQKIRNQGPQVQ